MTLLTPTQKALITQGVLDIIDTVGRDVTFEYVASTGICPVCSGTNPFCGTCNGNPTYDTLATLTVTAAIYWKISTVPETKKYRPEGQYIEGDCQLKVPLDSITSEVLDKTRRVTVDGKYCTIKGYYIKGSPETNRYQIVLNEEGRSDGSYRL